jgi:HD-GYP domain-containing protein (c-di-GMP phosphodiesterase class II)
VGCKILSNIDFSFPVSRIIYQHHERINGSGYPNGLKGAQILLEAKIIGVADVVESMASHRPYRPALGMDKALAELEEKRGILYDPEVVDACLNLFRQKKFDFG